MSDFLRIEAPLGVDASERRRRRALWGMVLAVVTVLGLIGGTVVTTSGVLCALSYVPCVGGLLSVALAVGAYRRPTFVPGVIGVVHDRLVVDAAAGTRAELLREASVPLSEITQGYWEGPETVRLVLKSGEAVVARLNRATGDVLLKACGVAPQERVLHIPLASAAARLPGGPTLVGIVLGGLFTLAVPMTAILGGAIQRSLRYGRADPDLSPMLFAEGVLMIIAVLLGALLLKRQAVVGSDGVLFRGSLRRRFHPYTSIAKVERHDRGVKLEGRDGKSVVLPTGRALSTEGELYQNALMDRIGEALAAGGEGALAQAALERLERRGRTLEAWRAELAKLAESADYRRASLNEAELGSVIEDPSAPVERRIGAAVALSTSQPEEARRRVRIAVQTCADDELREALEAAAEGEIVESVVKRSQR